MIMIIHYLFLENRDSLIFEWFAELHHLNIGGHFKFQHSDHTSCDSLDCGTHLCTLRIDSEGRHDEVRPFTDKLPYQPCPLLLENTNKFFNIKWQLRSFT